MTDYTLVRSRRRTLSMELKRDGTVVAVGDEDGKCDVGGWTDIKLPSDR